jgi:hypothetical protein
MPLGLCKESACGGVRWPFDYAQTPNGLGPCRNGQGRSVSCKARSVAVGAPGNGVATHGPSARR